MKYYCAACGRDLMGLAVNNGNYSYHRKCIPEKVEDEPKASVVRDRYVKHIGENRVTSELRDLTAMLDMINNPHPHLVVIK